MSIPAVWWIAGTAVFTLGLVVAWLAIDARSRRRRAILEGQFAAIAPDPDADLRKLMNQAPIGYYELDESGRFRFANLKEADLRGLSAAEIVGKFLWDLEPQSLQLLSLIHI